MANYDFWRDLAVSFQSASKVHEFTAYRYYYLRGGVEPAWQFGKLDGDEGVLAEFYSMARRGASMFAVPPTGDLAFAWLEALWEEATHGSVRSSSEILEGGSDLLQGKPTVPVRLRGKIDCVFAASSTLCRKLESEALQAGVEERRRNDPKYWSEFHRQFEAFEGIKEIRNAPAKRVPEEFARNTIARIYGIKPEEVTQEQIAFEIAGLLPFYPHIELIPSAPHQEPSLMAQEKHVYVGMENGGGSW
jgi:hypothetical protein